MIELHTHMILKDATNHIYKVLEFKHDDVYTRHFQHAPYSVLVEDQATKDQRWVSSSTIQDMHNENLIEVLDDFN